MVMRRTSNCLRQKSSNGSKSIQPSPWLSLKVLTPSPFGLAPGRRINFPKDNHSKADRKDRRPGLKDPALMVPMASPPRQQGWQRPGQSDTALVAVTGSQQHNFQGISADYLKEVASLTGITFKTVVYAGKSPKAAINELVSGKVDLLPAIMNNQPRGFPLSVSAPYFRTPIVVVMRSDAVPINNVSQLNSMKLAGLMSIPPILHKLGLTTRLRVVNPPNPYFSSIQEASGLK
jgi:ABC-type amino acid transport substrate-binding protein